MGERASTKGRETADDVGIRETLPECVLCAGTGKVVLMRSWFRADGFKRASCAICGGSGRSSTKPANSYVRAQADLRTLADAHKNPLQGEIAP